ncbi:hypothetical protein HDU81_002979 [Chytriomyces hyalinus]|nr:hypothetical protein HDU81_002979 [Chytriomyces hyalinus]
MAPFPATVAALLLTALVSVQVSAQKQKGQTREVRKYYSEPNCQGDITGFEFNDVAPTTCVDTSSCREGAYNTECQTDVVFNDLPGYSSKIVNGAEIAQIKLWSNNTCDSFSKMFHFKTNSCIRMDDPAGARSTMIEYKAGSLEMVHRRFSDSSCLSELASSSIKMDLRIRDCSERIDLYNAFESVDIFPLPDDPIVRAVLTQQPLPVTNSPGTPVGAVAGGIVGALAIVIAAVVGLLCYKRRNKGSALQEGFVEEQSSFQRSQYSAGPEAGASKPAEFNALQAQVFATNAAPETIVQQTVQAPAEQAQNPTTVDPLRDTFLTSRSSEKRNFIDSLSTHVPEPVFIAMRADPGPLPSKADYYREAKQQAQQLNMGAGPAPALDLQIQGKDKTALFEGLQLPADPLQWTVEHVTEWMTEVSDENVALKAKENDISGAALLLLRTEDLEKLGLTGIGPRLRVERAIAGLNNRSQAVAEPSFGQVVVATVTAQSQARQTREVKKYYSQPNCKGEVAGFEFTDATPSTCVATETCRNEEYTIEYVIAVFNDLTDYTCGVVNGQQFAQVKIRSRVSCDYFSKMFHFRTNSCVRMTDPGEAHSMRIDYAEGNLQMVRRRFSDAGCLSELTGPRSIMDLRIRDCSEPISGYNAYDSVDIFPLPSDPVVSAVLKGQPLPLTTASAPRTTSVPVPSSPVASTSILAAPATTSTIVPSSPSTGAISSTTASSSLSTTTSASTTNVAKSDGETSSPGNSVVTPPGNSVAVIAGGVAGGIAVLAAVMFGVVFYKRRRTDAMQKVPTAEGDFFQPSAVGRPGPQNLGGGNFFQPAVGKQDPKDFEVQDMVVARSIPETTVQTPVQAIYPACEPFSQQSVHVPTGQRQQYSVYSPVPSSFMIAHGSELSEKRNLVGNLSACVGGTSVTTMLADPGPLPSKVAYYREEEKDAEPLNLGAGPAPVFDYVPVDDKE